MTSDVGKHVDTLWSGSTSKKSQSAASYEKYDTDESKKTQCIDLANL